MPGLLFFSAAFRMASVRAKGSSSFSGGTASACRFSGAAPVSDDKFFPGEEGKPLVDGIKKGMRLKVQGRLNMDRFYGDMVLEPVAVATAEKKLHAVQNLDFLGRVPGVRERLGHAVVGNGHGRVPPGLRPLDHVPVRAQLKKRGAWVVAFDMTDYTGSIRVNKFFPGGFSAPPRRSR